MEGTLLAEQSLLRLGVVDGLLPQGRQLLARLVAHHRGRRLSPDLGGVLPLQREFPARRDSSLLGQLHELRALQTGHLLLKGLFLHYDVVVLCVAGLFGLEQACSQVALLSTVEEALE